MLNKKTLSALALIGISSTAILSANNTCGGNCISNMVAAATSTSCNANSQPLSSDQQAFADKLSSSSQKSFCAMDNDGRAMAMKMAHDCKGKNSCKGQGACKSDSNDCKGKNACKGKGSCKVDGNKAVDMACKKMADKRNGSGN